MSPPLCPLQEAVGFGYWTSDGRCGQNVARTQVRVMGSRLEGHSLSRTRRPPAAAGLGQRTESDVWALRVLVARGVGPVA